MPAPSGSGEEFLLSFVAGTTSSWSMWREETLFVDRSGERRCGGLSFCFCGKEEEGIVESGGRDCGGERREGSVVIERVGGCGCLRCGDSDLDGGER